MWKAFVFQVYWILSKASVYNQNVKEINNHILLTKLYST